jgi:hypothetical protein
VDGAHSSSVRVSSHAAPFTPGSVTEMAHHMLTCNSLVAVGSLRGGVALNISARCRTFQERRCATQHHHRPQSPVQCSPLRASPLTPRSGDGMVPGTGRTIDPSHPTGGTSARAVDLRADRFFSAFPRVPLSPSRLFTDAFTCRFKGAVVSTRARCACALGVPGRGLTLAARPLTGDLGARRSRAPVSLD